MSERKSHGLLWIGGLLAGFVAFATLWIEVLWPPVARFAKTADQPGSLATILWELLKPLSFQVYDKPFFGWLFYITTAILLVGLAYFGTRVARYIERSRLPITLLTTEMHLVIEDETGEHATLHRKQAFFATRPGLRLYQLSHSADAPGAAVVRESIVLNSRVGGEQITKTLLIRGHTSSVQVKESYKRDLPNNIFLTFTPNWLINLLHDQGLLERFIVVRTGKVKYIGEYSAAEPIISVSSPVFLILKTRLKVTFPKDAAPSKEAFIAFRINSNVADEVPIDEVTDEPGRVSYEVCVRNLRRESLHIQWQNRRPSGTAPQEMQGSQDNSGVEGKVS